MTRVAVFVAVSALAVYASRSALGRPGSHGYYRFFAWECILALLVLNFRGFGEWFRDPLSARQLVSWLLLGGSLVPLGFGVHLLQKQGASDEQARRDPTLFRFEQTTRLVETGVYHYIQHPLYASLLLLTWGVFPKRPSWIGAVLAVGASALLLATALAEERENAIYFGAAYEAYRRRTKRFIPFLF